MGAKWETQDRTLTGFALQHEWLYLHDNRSGIMGQSHLCGTSAPLLVVTGPEFPPNFELPFIYLTPLTNKQNNLTAVFYDSSQLTPCSKPLRERCQPSLRDYSLPLSRAPKTSCIMEVEFLGVLRAEPTWTHYWKTELAFLLWHNSVKGALQEGKEGLRFLKTVCQDHNLLFLSLFPCAILCKAQLKS